MAQTDLTSKDWEKALVQGRLFGLTGVADAVKKLWGGEGDQIRASTADAKEKFDTYEAQKAFLSGDRRLSRKGRKKAAKKRAKEEAQAKVAAEQQYQYAKAEQAQKQGIKGVEQAYGDAMKQASRGAELARQSVREAGAAAGTQATQSMVSRGLYGTTVQDQAQRAVTGDTARNLGLINTALAEQQGQLGVSQALAKQGGLGQLSALYPALAGMKTDTAFNFLKAFQKAPKQKPNILGALAGGIGMALGGPIGGAIGGSLGSAFGGSSSGGASLAGDLAPTLSPSSPYTYGPGQYKSTYWNQPLEF